MTKLSQVREEFDRVAHGEWLRFRDTTICVRVRGFLTNEYQRALRAVLGSFPKLADDATPEQRIERDEAVGRAMIPHLTQHVLMEWWGVDAEADPIPAGTEAPRLVGEVAGLKLEVVELDGHLYRPIEDGMWQEMVPYSPSTAEVTLMEPRCGELLDVVRAAAGVVDNRELVREAEALGKRATSSNGKSSTATTPKR